MGWLGWSESQTLDAAMPSIEAAYKGRLKMLQIMTGGAAQASNAQARNEVSTYPMTVQLLDTILG